MRGAPSHPQRLSLPLLQLQPEPCFSPVAQMRPWWSPVSIVFCSASEPPLQRSLQRKSLQRSLPCLPTSSPEPGLLSTPPTMAACHPLVIIPCVAFQGLDCPWPLSASSFPRGGCSALPSQVLSPHVTALPRPQVTTAHCPLPLQVSAGAPQSWWLEAVSLSCPASSKSKGR